jgi:hypothetical protein
MRALMVRAGRTVIGAELRVGEPQIVHHHQRLYDKRRIATSPEVNGIVTGYSGMMRTRG